MENKKMPFAVFVLKWIENEVKQCKVDGEDEFDVLAKTECEYCPLYNKQCDGYMGYSKCREQLKKYVESAE